MSGLSYASLRDRIRDAPVLDLDDEGNIDGAPADDSVSSFESLFSRPVGAPSADEPIEPADTIFDLRLTRLTSGWGGIAGLIVGALLGATGGVPGFFIGAILGILAGSLLAIGGLVLLSGAVARLGAAWTILIAGLVVVLATWLMTLRA